jgi:hypothetical protein
MVTKQAHDTLKANELCSNYSLSKPKFSSGYALFDDEDVSLRRCGVSSLLYFTLAVNDTMHSLMRFTKFPEIQSEKMAYIIPAALKIIDSLCREYALTEEFNDPAVLYRAVCGLRLFHKLGVGNTDGSAVLFLAPIFIQNYGWLLKIIIMSICNICRTCFRLYQHQPRPGKEECGEESIMMERKATVLACQHIEECVFRILKPFFSLQIENFDIKYQSHLQSVDQSFTYPNMTYSFLIIIPPYILELCKDLFTPTLFHHSLPLESFSFYLLTGFQDLMKTCLIKLDSIRTFDVTNITLDLQKLRQKISETDNLDEHKQQSHHDMKKKLTGRHTSSPIKANSRHQSRLNYKKYGGKQKKVDESNNNQSKQISISEDHIQFIESLQGTLRSEVLLTLESSYLETLPVTMIEEARDAGNVAATTLLSERTSANILHNGGDAGDSDDGDGIDAGDGNDGVSSGDIANGPFKMNDLWTLEKDTFQSTELFFEMQIELLLLFVLACKYCDDTSMEDEHTDIQDKVCQSSLNDLINRFTHCYRCIGWYTDMAKF